MSYEPVVACQPGTPCCFAELLDGKVVVAGMMAIRDIPHMGIARARLLYKFPHVPSEVLWGQLMPQALAHLHAHGIGKLTAIAHPDIFHRIYYGQGWEDTGQREQFGSQEVVVMARNVGG